MNFMGEPVGKVTATVRIWNVMAESDILAGRKQPWEMECLVGNGAVMVVIPEELADRLGLSREPRQMIVTYADGRSEALSVAIGLRLEVLGRSAECRAIAEPNRKGVLLDQIALEDLDLLVDWSHRRLVPNDPSGPTTAVFKAAVG